MHCTFTTMKTVQIFLLLGLTLGPAAIFALPTMEELQLVFQRRQMTASELYNDSALVTSWRNSLLPDGKWPDVDYTAGCEADRAEWPAQDHVLRIDYMVSGFFQNQTDTDLLAKIHLAMDFWFDNEYPHEDCINGGGRPELQCPCGTPGLWNTNWWYAMIGLPIKLGNACIMLDSHLTPTQRSNCTAHTSRAYVRINGDPNGSLNNHTGANRLDIASSGVAYAVMTGDLEVLDDAFFQFHDTIQFIRGNLDGTKVDGSFLYHNAQLYSGNYGMHFINQMLAAMMHTFGTSLELPQNCKDVAVTLVEGSEWMIFFRGDGGPEDEDNLNWQHSTVGREISWKYEDRPTSINISLSYMVEGTQGWDNHDRFVAVTERLRQRRTGSANPGPLIGTKHFWMADYLVHRGQNYVVNLKMFSPRIVNTECINNENFLGFHLSDGAIFTYVRGTEYHNVFGAWDWYLVPGTTVNHGATPLVCGDSRYYGKEAFVGGVSFGNAGIAVMNYTNPMTGSLHWAKTFFFFPGAYVVQYVGDFVVSDSSAPIVTNLDQRQLGSGGVYVDGGLLDSAQARVTAQSIYHDRVGYSFQSPVTLDIDTRERPSNWSSIGMSSGFDPETLFSATMIHDGVREGETYIAYLDVDQIAFEQLSKQTRAGLDSESGIKILDSKSKGQKDSRAYPEVRGATYGSSTGTGDRIIALAFWDPTSYSTGETDITAVSVDIPCVVLLTRKPGGPGAGWTVSVADPSQRATSLNLFVTIGFVAVSYHLDLPTGDFAGSPVSLDLTY